MEELIRISQLNDFIFCPASIYFHNLYGNQSTVLYQVKEQINGTQAHKAIDEHYYTNRKSVLTGIDVCCEKYGLIGKIDILDIEKKLLVERKKKIQKVYDGYIYQLYGQYFSLKEMNYDIEKMCLHSIDDNKVYSITIPEKDVEKYLEFEKLITQIMNFKMDNFKQTNSEKCKKCIYEPACDRGIQ